MKSEKAAGGSGALHNFNSAFSQQHAADLLIAPIGYFYITKYLVETNKAGKAGDCVLHIAEVGTISIIIPVWALVS